MSMTGRIDDINARTPFIGYNEYIRENLAGDSWEDMFDMGTQITLNEKYSQLSDEDMKLSPYFKKDRTGKNPYITQMMSLPPSVAKAYWEKIKSSTQVFGPREIRTARDMEIVAKFARGNYVIISNIVSNEWSFIWSPVIEASEAFAKHWQIFRYIFETGIVPREERIWKLWCVGETSNNGGKRERSGEAIIHINHYSGSFRHKIDDILHSAKNNKESVLTRHYEDVTSMLTERYEMSFRFVNTEVAMPRYVEYEELKIDCPLLPKAIGDFNELKCYRYNVLPGTFWIFNLYRMHLTKNSILDSLKMPHMANFMQAGTTAEQLQKRVIELSTLHRRTGKFKKT